ncbi:sh3 domain containing protein [Grosmannia clavigera kw1407]|uniref:Sh3 domain containing protein n=1 Tax=Grosmannia clavigera (strain kw1407 / UAMH 11150) TaxID=655863 RepID=F0XT25_GROCL|nr:sh3 domain containing protein [Grosmannia clavigera kw1407]EFW99247.1 sh3 domain containing protein [Grosmannia clavigera kw1407]
MAAIVSPSSSPATSPPVVSSSPLLNPTQAPVPQPLTSPTTRRTNLQRPMSHASKNRLSQYSVGSVPPRSRPTSHVFPLYPSSLPYASVRDFAYPPVHPLHYGPPPEPSRPASIVSPSFDTQSQRRLSDPPFSWETKTSWDTDSWENGSYNRAIDLPPIYLADGPPWSEDEDLQSPVVSSRHRKHKSASSAYAPSRRRSARVMESIDAEESFSGSVGVAADIAAAAGTGGGDNGNGAGDATNLLNPNNLDHERGYFAGTSGDGSERYYVNQGGEANGPGGEYVTYPAGQTRQSAHQYQLASQQPRNYGGYHPESDASSPVSSPDFREDDQSRYSRDYQFTITSPDEEMHGKAVALFDFSRENENELPLVEGQIIWVSYRHGQGWLVAMDPKTQESGLVPEEYVRLLRDIEGGMTSLTGQVMANENLGSPNDADTPTQLEHSQGFGGHTPTPSNASNSYPQPVVSTFSTSSKDLDPYPQHLLGTQAGQVPPQVVHYHGQRGGSQANTPTLLSHQDIGTMRRGSQDLLPAKKGEAVKHSSLGSLLGDAADAAEEMSPNDRHGDAARNGI